ncbi:MAG: phosphoglycerate kinase [Firmicutes bacterium]|nr:phosphoglycerate kinase [Bacillota bacterium]
MNYHKKSIRDVDVSNKKVLLRCDFNVPHDKKTGIIQDVTRIAESVPTIQYLLEQGAAVIICSHLGRPHGIWNPALSLASVAGCLQSILNKPVPITRDVLGSDTKALAGNLHAGQVMLIENLRFRIEEERNDPLFSKELASLAHLFVFDAFGASHRAHSSTEGVTEYLPAVAGFLIEKELAVMGAALESPRRPFVSIMGGSKVSDKIGVIRKMLDTADTIIIGGGMAYTFLAAQGHSIGTSLVETEQLDFAREMLQLAQEKGVTLLLPTDHMAASHFSKDAEPHPVDNCNIPDGYMGLDIGPCTINLYKNALKDAGTVFWNGPMGVFEFPAFANGTFAIAKAMAEMPQAITIIGGGDSAFAVEQMGFSNKMTHISTGGGAALEFMEGLSLPGIACLEDAE